MPSRRGEVQQHRFGVAMTRGRFMKGLGGDGSLGGAKTQYSTTPVGLCRENRPIAMRSGERDRERGEMLPLFSGFAIFTILVRIR